MLLSFAHRLLAPGGPRGRLSILIFHRVVAEPDPMWTAEVDAQRFDSICGWLKEFASVLPLDEAVDRLRSRSLPARALAITFDDGYADNHDVALPILRRHGLPATVFVATGFVGGPNMWNDRIVEALRQPAVRSLGCDDLLEGWPEPLDLTEPSARRQTAHRLIRAVKYLPAERRLEIVAELERRCRDGQAPGTGRRLMMDGEQIRALRRAGVGIGAHTVNHPILRTLDRETARREIGASRDALSELLREPIRMFAYPNGKPGVDYGPEAVGLVRDLGFQLAVSTAPGAADAASDRLQLPRFTPWDRTRSRYGLRLLANLWR